MVIIVHKKDRGPIAIPTAAGQPANRGDKKHPVSLPQPTKGGSKEWDTGVV